MDLFLESTQDLEPEIQCMLCYKEMRKTGSGFMCPKGHWRCGVCIHHETYTRVCMVCERIGLMRRGPESHTVCPFRFKTAQMHKLDHVPSKIAHDHESVQRLGRLLEDRALSIFLPVLWSTDHASVISSIVSRASESALGIFSSLPSPPLFPDLSRCCPRPPSLDVVDPCERIDVVVDPKGCNGPLLLLDFEEHTTR